NKLTGKHYRLPTETEWEYACRGGENSEQYQYSGSNNADDVAWFYENRRNRTNPVGQKKPNELDIYDMNGNVDEICKNQYDKNVQLHEEITLITRGGNILNYEKDLRISRRGHIYLNEKSPFTGFRLACDK
ncbi:MAG: formylglycine-generating enzyme family protein, partial [Prevotellaceae bacterium]|nr:formylglycine-generating enzyme family protein [Prevotellaceae bacterium]